MILSDLRFRMKRTSGYHSFIMPTSLALAVMLLVFAIGPAISQAQDDPSAQTEATKSETVVLTDSPEEKPAPPVFGFGDVEKLAKQTASLPYNKIREEEAVKNIHENSWKKINFKEEYRLWRDQNLPFEAGFFHPGFIFNNMTPIFVVDDKSIRTFDFKAEYFNNQEKGAVQAAQDNRLNYAGFQLLYPFNHLDSKDEALSFLGATHFRALPKRSRYGLEARGLIINPSKTEGEEFPYFRKFWLVKPGPEDQTITIYALMDSPSLTGAYQFELAPGPTTIMKVKAALFKRGDKDEALKIGLAPMGSMYLFSEKENGAKNDWRPEVHNSDILLWTEGDNKWKRRPLSNPERLEVNCFELNSPKGFGLMQQDGNFDHYQDFDNRFDLKPSLWIEPEGDWGSGSLELMELPARQDIHNNIIAFWTPSGEQAVEGRFDFAYNMYWMPSATIPHQLGRAVNTRLRRDAESGVYSFLIDFEDGPLNDISADSGLSSTVNIFPETPVLEKSLVKNPVTGGWRLTFKLNEENGGVVQSLLSARGDRKSLRLEAFLKKGENLPEALTETWIFDLPIK